MTKKVEFATPTAKQISKCKPPANHIFGDMAHPELFMAFCSFRFSMNGSINPKITLNEALLMQNILLKIAGSSQSISSTA
jgi:hypothetical protein